MNGTDRKCKYCGASMGKGAGDICHNCYTKLPLVREIKAIGKKIKAGVKK